MTRSKILLVRTVLVALVGACVCVFLGYRWYSTRDTCGDMLDAHAPALYVVHAFELEQDAFLRQVTVEGQCQYRGVSYSTARHAGVPFVSYRSGVGPEQARTTAVATLERFAVPALVMAGIAGSPDQFLPVGSVLVAKQWGDVNATYQVTATPALVARAEHAGALPTTYGVTAHKFVANSSKLPAGATLVDMESAAVLAAAVEAGVPTVAIRAVSDHVNGEDTAADWDHAAQEAALVTLEFIRLSADVPY